MGDVYSAVQAVRSLGIPIELTNTVISGTFFPGAWIDHGVVYVNPDVVLLGDVFHEAGHLAVTPSGFRDLWRPAGVNLDDPDSLLCQAVERRFQESYATEDFEIRALLQMGETEAIAWEYAAIEHLGFDAEQCFGHPDRFSGGGFEVLWGLDHRNYLGIHGLHHAKMTTINTFPKMLKWLQD